MRIWPILKNVLFTVLVPGTVAGWLPYWLFGPYVLHGDAPSLIAGVVLIAGGAALYVACVWPFASIGEGTPAPIDPPVRLIVVGPYRVVRNPMYVAVLLVIFGQSLILHSGSLALYGVGVASVFHLVVIGYEELVLERQFGDDYRAYRKRVPRWIPRIRLRR
jgi:protein-S-isoprenylcysteine O-methyltransferase Ste14